MFGQNGQNDVRRFFRFGMGPDDFDPVAGRQQHGLVQPGIAQQSQNAGDSLFLDEHLVAQAKRACPMVDPGHERPGGIRAVFGHGVPSLEMKLQSLDKLVERHVALRARFHIPQGCHPLGQFVQSQNQNGFCIGLVGAGDALFQVAGISHVDRMAGPAQFVGGLHGRGLGPRRQGG